VASSYSPLTAADEKIPLSMVPVNRKPQHLVLSGYLSHPVAKHGEIACGKLKKPCGMRISESDLP
jgi:hypothetical protein